VFVAVYELEVFAGIEHSKAWVFPSSGDSRVDVLNGYIDTIDDNASSKFFARAFHSELETDLHYGKLFATVDECKQWLLSLGLQHDQIKVLERTPFKCSTLQQKSRDLNLFSQKPTH